MNDQIPLVARFQKVRWSRTRKRIHDMRPGQTRKFNRTDYFNCHASVYRLNDAYGERHWTMKVSGERITVKRKLA